jgi:hypothetical protein
MVDADAETEQRYWDITFLLHSSLALLQEPDMETQKERWAWLKALMKETSFIW